MAWEQIWSVEHLGSKVSAAVSPDGTEVSIGITNMLSRTGVSNSVSLREAEALAFALLYIVQRVGEASGHAGPPGG